MGGFDASSITSSSSRPDGGAIGIAVSDATNPLRTARRNNAEPSVDGTIAPFVSCGSVIVALRNTSPPPLFTSIASIGRCGPGRSSR
jgi:hypothetical protein